MESETLNPNAPIAWPVVKIDDIEIIVKYSMGLTYRAAKIGLDLTALADRSRAIAVGFDLFALIAAPQLQALGKPVLTGEEWAEKLGSLQRYAEVSAAIAAAYQLSKVGPAEISPNPISPESTGNRPN